MATDVSVLVNQAQQVKTVEEMVLFIDNLSMVEADNLDRFCLANNISETELFCNLEL